MAEILDKGTAGTGNGDLAGLDGAGDALANGDFLRVVKKLHFLMYLIRIKESEIILKLLSKKLKFFSLWLIIFSQ